MRRRVIIGGAVYRQALQAPKEDAFKQVEPQLVAMHDKALAIKRYLWKKFHSDPAVFLDVMNKLLPHIERIPTIQDAQKLDKWAGYFGTIGLKLIDNAETAKNRLQAIKQTIETFEKLRQQAEAKSKISTDLGYAKIVEAVNSFLQDMTTPIV
jgi:hypothetical protein